MLVWHKTSNSHSLIPYRNMHVRICCVYGRIFHHQRLLPDFQNISDFEKLEISYKLVYSILDINHYPNYS